MQNNSTKIDVIKELPSFKERLLKLNSLTEIYNIQKSERQQKSSKAKK